MINDGLGILNLGLGNLGAIKCGKTEILNDLIYPVNSKKNFLFHNETNIMNTGTVDLFFENMCEYKRNLVLMDA